MDTAVLGHVLRQLQLRQDAANVRLHGLARHDQFERDAAIRLALGDEPGPPLARGAQASGLASRPSTRVGSTTTPPAHPFEGVDELVNVDDPIRSR
jgi:hypothetical protein